MSTNAPCIKALQSVDLMNLKDEAWTIHSSTFAASNFQIWFKREEMKGKFGPTERANLFATNFKHLKNKQTIQIKFEETWIY